jgi:ATP-dependent DNA helicase HFM1/MER3
VDFFEKLANADPRQLELITGRRFPYGDQVKESLHLLPPQVDLTIRETGLRIGNKNEFTVELTRKTQPKVNSRWHFADLVSVTQNQCTS